jgi:hypothetical protein
MQRARGGRIDHQGAPPLGGLEPLAPAPEGGIGSSSSGRILARSLPLAAGAATLQKPEGGPAEARSAHAAEEEDLASPSLSGKDCDAGPVALRPAYGGRETKKKHLRRSTYLPIVSAQYYHLLISSCSPPFSRSALTAA